MNEMNLLEDFRASVAPPDHDALASARVRVLNGGRRPRPRPRFALTGLAAAATAAAVVAALTVHGATPVQHSPVSQGRPSPAVQELAYRAAAAAATGPNVRPGQWVYWKETVTSQGPRPATPEGTFQVWTTASSTRAAYIERGQVVFAGKGPFIGQPVPYRQSVSYESGPMPVSYARLGSLPADPVALDHYLAGTVSSGWGPAPVREFAVIRILLTSYVMPPGLTAELYRALGDIPGVTVAHAVDVAGRHGIGFQIAMPPTMGSFAQLILDPKTYALMGQTLLLPGGMVLSGTAILKTALVSGPGVLP